MVNYRKELRMEVDIRKKKKDRKNNIICEKNEKDTRGS